MMRDFDKNCSTFFSDQVMLHKAKVAATCNRDQR